MRSYSSRKLIKALVSHGWIEVSVRGSHHQFKNPAGGGRVTVPHPKKDLPWPTVKSILQQSGLSEKDLEQS